LEGGQSEGAGDVARGRDLAWERDVPLAFYLDALDGMG
jgi:hypothetical protein